MIKIDWLRTDGGAGLRVNDGIVVGLRVGRLRSIGYGGSGGGGYSAPGGRGEARHGGRGGRVGRVQRLGRPGAASVATLGGTRRQPATGPPFSTPKPGVVTAAQTWILAAHWNKVGSCYKSVSIREEDERFSFLFGGSLRIEVFFFFLIWFSQNRVKEEMERFIFSLYFFVNSIAIHIISTFMYKIFNQTRVWLEWLTR